ncbi:hypothetical protein PV387_03390 [Streptomyces sp. ME02-6987-2C]|uniref:hypothetical protein n=1 Tax=unclassified Streptomyces TaxID=2593676 RepID=UPI0029BC450A|nr:MULTISPECIES: hypothetical protein [unclassified Streptomyces]MDX3345883.1 hypothetical protein [Streptomyces sp. ME02-6979A]MDX3365078.1 hypothetical protein [Streptomyces sp. ME02-6987-2C]MDX3404867.1 hypothetical protein [Streptomyces sp. ME02-6977A]MDX3421649.1 hypothetical protein [Streptomyces sp. ME02-6985-2c]
MSGTSGSVAAATPDDEYEILCDDAGTFLRRYSTEDGATVTTDTELDGTTAYTPTGAVVRCDAEQAPAANPQIDSTIQRQTGAGTVTIVAGARSVTLVVYAGVPTVAIGGGAAVTLAAGTSLTWGVDRGGDGGEQLQDEFVVTGVAGSDFLVTSTREA